MFSFMVVELVVFPKAKYVVGIGFSWREYVRL